MTVSDKVDNSLLVFVRQKVRQGRAALLGDVGAGSLMFGLAAFYIWNLTEIYGRPSVVGAVSGDLFVQSTALTSLAAIVGYAAVAIVLSRLRWFLRIATAMGLFAGVVSIVLSVLMWASVRVAPEAVLIGRVVMRACSACVLVAWGAQYSRLDSHSLTVRVFSAFLVALLGAWVVSVMPDIARDLMFSLSLPASALLLRRARMSPEADAHPGARQDDRTSQRSFISVVWRVVAALFVFGIATWIVILGAHGARGAGAGPGLNQTVLPVCAVAVGALMVVALASGRLLAQTFVYKFVLPLTLAGLLLVCAFSFESSVGVTLVCVAYTLFDMFLFIVIADTSGRTGIRAGAAFGWCRAIEGGVPLVVVILVSVLGNQTLAWGESVVAMLGVVMALVVGASVFVDGSGIFAQDRPDRAISYPRPEAFLFACQCEQIVEDYALSMRESEVMELIVRGRSVPHISERLGISRSTVKTHVARIYQKLGVGNRQEMIDLIETVEVSPDLTSGRGLGR